MEESMVKQICDICSMCTEALGGNMPPKTWLVNQFNLTDTEAESVLKHLDTLKYLHDAKLQH